MLATIIPSGKKWVLMCEHMHALNETGQNALEKNKIKNKQKLQQCKKIKRSLDVSVSM